jgi:hypothetical protein
MSKIRVEIVSREAFWRDAVIVEWEHQHPDRKLIAQGNDSYLIEKEWFDELDRIARDCFSTVVLAPANPERRSWFRRFVPLPLALLVLAGGQGIAQSKWQVLFDGKSTASWRGFRRDTFPSKCWTIDNGSLKTVAGCDKSDQIDIITKNKYRNFELEFEWRVSPGANSGVIYLVSEDEDQTWRTGPEFQVLDDDKHADGKNPKTSAGSLFALIAPANKTLRPVGEFNRARVIVNKGHVEHWLNGKKVLEYDLGSESLASAISASKFKDFRQFAKVSEGYIAFQYHGDEVWFRNIRVRSK